MIKYMLGDAIKDARYDGKKFLGCNIKTMPFTPNRAWQAPKFHPFTIDDLIVVHLTDQYVSDGVLKPHSYAPLKINDVVSGEEKKWFYPRETLHFTLNGIVDDHNGGYNQRDTYSWKDKKFAYIVPLVNVIGQVISLFTHDTILLGQLKLPDSTEVVLNQTPEKVKAAIKKKGYQFLDIEGVKQLDAAYLEGTRTNINHPVNFAQVLDNYNLDGPYTEASINNILLLDGYMKNVLSAAAYNEPLFKPHDEIVTELQNRMDYFKDRFGESASLSAPLMRLENGIDRYVTFLHALKQLDEKRYHVAKAKAELKAINEQLLWINN
jgi:hypothetical protein